MHAAETAVEGRCQRTTDGAIMSELAKGLRRLRRQDLVVRGAVDKKR